MFRKKDTCVAKRHVVLVLAMPAADRKQTEDKEIGLMDHRTFDQECLL